MGVIITAVFSDSNAPYLNHFNVAKRFSKVLFRSGRPAFAEELLEAQSIEQNQLAMLGDSLFQEGAIISGMDIVPKPDKAQDTKSSLPNLFTISSLFADHTRLDTSDYVAEGKLGVTSVATMPTDLTGFEFDGNVTKGSGVTVSFTITQTSGDLQRINIQTDGNNVTPVSWSIDGEKIQTAIGNATDETKLVDSNGNQIKLDDGKDHKVVANYKTNTSGPVTFTLVINGGYDVSIAPYTANINHLYVEDGNKATDWVINPKDNGAASSILRTKNYTVNSGRVYLNGQVREFDSQDFSIKGTGKEVIGLKLNEDVVTSQQDPSLLDDTPGSVTRGDAGADRLHYNVVLTYNDDSATPFATFNNNVLNQRAVKPDYSNLEPILAKRTYDQSGSFRSYGFEGHLRANPDKNKGAQDPDDASKIDLDIDAGQAYVRGYSISTSAPTTLKLDVANQQATALNEGYYFGANTTSIQLLNQPVYKVTNVTYTSKKTTDPLSITVGGNNVTKIPYTDNVNVTFIDRVWDASQTYENGKDFSYIGNEIHWGEDLQGNPFPDPHRPASTFQIEYEYSVNAVEGTDYKVVNDHGTTSIQFISTSTNKPRIGTTVNVTYQYFEARIDMIRITMNQSDPFKIVRGTPAPLSKVKPPISKDPLSLELGYVLIEPNSNRAIFTMQTITRITFNTLQQWGQRLTNTEYNVAIDRMAEDVKRDEDPTILKDAFSDGFASINNRDDGATTVAYDFESGEIMLPSQAQASLTPKINETISNIALKGDKGHLVVPPYHAEEAINQPIATGIVNVNEYDVFSANGELDITPDSDQWVDTRSTVAYTTRNMGTVNLHKWWRHTNDQSRAWQGDGRTEAAWAADERTQEMQWDKLNGLYDPHSGNTLGETGWMIGDGGSATTDTMIEYMRPNTITFTASNLSPLTDGYSITIDGTPVQNTKADDPKYAYKTADDGTVLSYRTDAKGVIKGSFDIPGGTIRCGTRVVKITNSNGDIASANYTCTGTLETTTNTIEKRIYTVNLWDPLAQSFYLQQTRQLDSIDLFFLHKPDEPHDGQSHKPELIVQIREVSDDGYPNRMVRGEVHLDPSQIQTSEDGSKGTRVTFNDSITLQANQGYAVVLISDSDEYKLFYAKKGQSVAVAGASETCYNTNPDALLNKDPQAQGQNVVMHSNVSVNVGDVLQKTPNANGDMFISNNGMTWSADGAASLKFRVNVCSYEKNGQVVFDPIVLQNQGTSSTSVWNVNDLGPTLDGKSKTPNTELTNIDRLVTLCQFLTYQNTSLHWYIRVLQNSNFAGTRNITDALNSMPWTPISVINGGVTTKAPGEGTANEPKITSDRSPQQVDGELNFFQNTVAVQLMAEFAAGADRYIAPVLTTEDLSLGVMLTAKQAAYQSINCDESGDAEFNKVKLQYDGYIPDMGTALPKINPIYSVDGGTTWYNFPANGKESKQVTNINDTDSSQATNTKRMSAFFTRYTFNAIVPGASDSNHLADEFMVRLNLQSPNNFYSVRVRKLTALMKCDLDTAN